MPAKKITSLARIDRQVRRIEQSVKSAQEVTKHLDSLKGDGWYNSLVGLGKKFDKSNKTFFGDFYFMDRNQLSRLYVGDGMGRKIIDRKADDMTREWIELEMEDEDEMEVLKQTSKKLKAQQYFNEALKWERLFGGSSIVLGAMDGKPLDEPMLVQNVKSIEWLKVVDMWDIDLPSSEWDRDPTSPTYGQIIRYMCQFRVSGTGRIDRLLVHNSRILPFYGENIPKSLVMGDQRTRYWGASVLQAIWEKLANFGGVEQSVVNILYEFIIGKYKFSNLDEILAAGNEPALTNRMSVIQMSKSVINGVMLGTDEDYLRESANVSGLADLVDRMMMILSAVCDYPVTILFGRSPAGMNATGESDLTNYYDSIKAKQGTDLEPNLSKFFNLLAEVNKFQGIVKFKFNPLKQSSPKEQSEIDKAAADSYLAYAQGDQIYLMNQVASPEEIALEREFITEDEFAMLRGEIEPDDADNAEEKLKQTPGEGSSVSPASGAQEKNLLEKTGKEKNKPLSKKKANFNKQPTSATPPLNEPGTEVY